MNRGLYLLGGMGMGAALMYLLDPEAGRKRRARLRDQAVHTVREAGVAFTAAGQDLVNRAGGLVLQAAACCEGEVPDGTLVERVRSRLGHCVRDTRGLEVTAQNGRVTLRGAVRAGEVEPLLACVASVPGVREVENSLEVGGERETVPERGVYPPALLPRDWPPSLRLLAGGTGVALVAAGVSQGAPLACLLGTAGLGLFLRGLSNRPLPRLVHSHGQCPSIEVQKTLTLAAPLERVFEFWANYENFPRFMTHVREVHDLGEGRSHWVVAGPSGVRIEWDATLTEFAPDERVAWRTEPGSAITHHGQLRFEGTEDGGTRIHIRLTYTPPAGVLGHVLAGLLGSDPKSKMDADLLRMKTLVETGHAPHDAAEKLPVPPLERLLTPTPPPSPVGWVGSDGYEPDDGRDFRVVPSRS